MATTMISERYVETYSASLFAIEMGQGPPLLFLHGVTANAFIWLPVMEQLQHSYRTVAIDQRGHGRSSAGSDRRYDAWACARDVTDVAASLQAGPVVVIGHSLGARNAIVAGASRPAVIAGVIAIDFAPFIAPAIFDALDARVAGGSRNFGSHGEVTSYLSERYQRLPADAVERRARYGYEHGTDGRIAPLAQAAAMQLTCSGLRQDLAPDLLRLGVPAVLVRGADSALVSPEAFGATRALRPDLPGVIVQGADHYVPEERPAEVARIVEEFCPVAFARGAAGGTGDKGSSS